ncbi:hypothetical protein [Caulobacter sp. UC70_42]|uniref:hypothetical protein n=1 Tax=Caulobacter sp. UC70_42 TaxID=3374551 RepID=UPI003756728E
MMAILLAPLGERVMIGDAVAIEHLSPLAIARGALPTQVAQVHLHRRRAIARAPVLDDAGLDDHAPGRQAPPRSSAAAEPPGAAARAMVQRSKTRTTGGGQDLADEASNVASSSGAPIAGPADPEAKIVFPLHEAALTQRSRSNL